MQPEHEVKVTTNVPAEIPVTTPVGLTVAAAELHDHVPQPPDRDDVPPMHMAKVPDIDADVETVTDVETQQPAAEVYVIVAQPADTPLTIPVDAPIVAIDGMALVQTPPATESLSVVVEPGHTLNVPIIGAGTGLTVIATCLEHPVGSE